MKTRWITLTCVFLTGLGMGVVIVKSTDLFQVVMVGLTMGYVFTMNAWAWKTEQPEENDDEG